MSRGLIIDEETGANIAVAYDARHARLIASEPLRNGIEVGGEAVALNCQ